MMFISSYRQNRTSTDEKLPMVYTGAESHLCIYCIYYITLTLTLTLNLTLTLTRTRQGGIVHQCLNNLFVN